MLPPPDIRFQGVGAGSTGRSVDLYLATGYKAETLMVGSVGFEPRSRWLPSEFF